SIRYVTSARTAHAPWNSTPATTTRPPGIGPMAARSQRSRGWSAVPGEWQACRSTQRLGSQRSNVRTSRGDLRPRAGELTVQKIDQGGGDSFRLSTAAQPKSQLQSDDSKTLRSTPKTR